MPAVAAQEPFSMRATVRFCRLCAAMSRSAVSMLQKMPALYVVEANTRWLQRNASETITEGCVAETSYMAIFFTPRAASLEARMFAAFSVLPYTEA